MNFEYELIELDEHDIKFVREPVNVLEWIKSFLKEKERDMFNIVAVTSRHDGNSVPFSEAKHQLDQLYYRNDSPTYLPMEMGCKPIDRPSFNFDLIINLNNGDFIDFKAFSWNTYDGGLMYYDLRYNYVRLGEWEKLNQDK